MNYQNATVFSSRMLSRQDRISLAAQPACDMCPGDAQMQAGCSVSQVAGAVLQLEGALRRIALDPQWNPATSPGESSPRGSPDGGTELPSLGELHSCVLICPFVLEAIEREA